MQRNADGKNDLPNWSAYIVRLGTLVKPVDSPNHDSSASSARQSFESMRVNTVPRRKATEHKDRVGVPIGGRRMYIGDRRNQVAQPLPGGFLQKMPYWSAYLKRLSMLVKPHPGSNDLAARAVENKPAHKQLSLGVWGYYFFAKLGMYWAELIGFHPLENLIFAAIIFWPVTSRFWSRVKGSLTAVSAVIMLYYDSWLPPVGRLLSQATLLSEFNFSYLLDLISRFFSGSVIGALLLAGIAYWIVSLWLRTSVLVFACMLALGVAQSPLFDRDGQDFGEGGTRQARDMATIAQDFFDNESQRAVNFVTPAANAVPFDVIFIHVCSLSWDDVRAAGLSQHPLWRRFDMLLTKFNSAASYSGPAAIHLLRASCGQQTHEKMYAPTTENCYLMSDLQHVGFEPSLALNHNGKFDDFLWQVKTHGRLIASPLSLDGLKVSQYAFDNSPVYDDLSVLKRWLRHRESSASPRSVLYYNTVSLHDGNHYPGSFAEPNTLKIYRGRLSAFLNGMENFMQVLERSGRHALVIMVPEHGAAVRGDKMQIAGLREIPTPAITLVPVGIKLVGGGVQREGETLIIDQPTSYLAIASLIERMLERSPFENNMFSPAFYGADLPITEFVAQNEKMTVIEYYNRFYFSHDGLQWEDYAEFNSPDDARR